MNKPITYKEGYRTMRAVGCDRLSSWFMATVWVLRGDKV